MNLYERLSMLAKKQKISIPQLSVKLGFSEQYLYKWKTNTPKADNLAKVADYFNVSTDYLLGRTDNPNPTSTGVELGWNDTIYKEAAPVDMTPKGRAIGRGFDQLDADKQDLFERLLKQMQEDDEDDD